MQKGFNSLNSDNKSVKQYKILPVPFVMLDKYFQKILNEAIGMQIIFISPGLLYYLATQATVKICLIRC